MKNTSPLLFVFAFCLLLLNACGESPTSSETTSPEPVATTGSDDINLAALIKSALLAADDLPQGLTVEVNEGHVLISGPLQCEDCGGMRTPGSTGTIQQSLGAIVRAVPGVTEVDFDLDYSL